ncbi:MAG: DUF5320 domain-containing protein, partial [Bacteroidales bacterium]|nr:DUF5320 domain-containing protein [Bacteroidales bacterium]
KEVIMPGYDQTGPLGQGAITGRRSGRCAKFAVKASEQSHPESVNPQENLPENSIPAGQGFGRGRGLGFMMGKGLGMGWRRSRGKGMQNLFRGGL